ncbi:hypothetical protein [Hymenobacter glacieicola]|uniref:Uncharacterized protein n=1 Tax=Hymenobacter glacieicola TaxID=1562124 RepID=A0ABQ1WPE2_9BACT|nr:hypothetical protein [Hymenobacter glacieicola]GGG39616.1 hypothetical protein GCM10011378_14870 [Hymenobacter glacieicola]
MEPITQNPSQLPGWNIDNDPENDPTYPMRTRTPDDHKGYSWERPTQQPINIEVLHSIERPNVTAVFGTSVPPSGLSGVIRRFAFKYSENSYLHWLPLLLADRVNVVEGIVEDLGHGKVPNIFAEKGYATEWKHNRTAFVAKMTTIAVVTVGSILILTRDKKKKHKYRY